jgi:hypothetical protein
MSDAARLVDELLRTGRYGPPTRPDPDDFAVAVGKLVHDKMDRHTAESLIRAAQGRGQDLIKWADYLLFARAEYRRKLKEKR